MIANVNYQQTWSNPPLILFHLFEVKIRISFVQNPWPALNSITGNYVPCIYEHSIEIYLYFFEFKKNGLLVSWLLLQYISMYTYVAPTYVLASLNSNIGWMFKFINIIKYLLRACLVISNIIKHLSTCWSIIFIYKYHLRTSLYI